MIIYVESNYLLEVALRQEESVAAIELLEAAERSEFQMIIPSFSLSEPIGTMTHRGREGIKFAKQLGDHLTQLFRSEPHRADLEGFDGLPGELIDIHASEANLLENTIDRLLGCAMVIPFERTVYRMATAAKQSLGLSLEDAIVYASVLADLGTRPPEERKVFVSRNYKDFSDPDIEQNLARFNCVYSSSYVDATRLVGLSGA